MQQDGRVSDEIVDVGVCVFFFFFVVDKLTDMLTDHELDRRQSGR